MSYQYHTADVFTDKAFGGNQLAVLPDARGLSSEQMAQIAREFNFSETVFVFPPDDASNTRKVRIFTPGTELAFAGHPTVGAAFVLAATGEIDLDGDETRIVFEEIVGPVPVLIRSVDGRPVFTQLTAAKPPERGDGSYDAATIADVISLSVDDLDVNGAYAIEGVSVGEPFLIIPVKSVEALGRARINMQKWEASLRGNWASEVFLFSPDESAGVMRARMFAPTMGIPEDPATGAACAGFGGYLAWRSPMRDGTLRHTVHQGVEMGRPSVIEVETDVKNGEVMAIRVGGGSVLISSGTLHAY